MSQATAVGNVILDAQLSLAHEVVGRHYERRPELEQRYGDVGRDRVLEDTCDSLIYLANAMRAGRPSSFADYASWLRTVLEARGVRCVELRDSFQLIGEVLAERIPAEQRQIVQQFLSAGFEALDGPAPRNVSWLEPDAPLAALAIQYLNLLLAGDRHRASRLILDAVAQKVAVKDVYKFVFQPVQYEIGRLWQTNQISVAQEHFATAVTQLVMSQLYPYVFGTQRVGRTLVATAVGGELHELGIRMVADFFEMAGWDTLFLGANTPHAAIVDLLQRRRVDALAISATLLPHVRQVERLVAAVRANPHGQQVKILVGGHAFNQAPELVERLGADGYAPDAEAAVALARRLVVAR